MAMEQKKVNHQNRLLELRNPGATPKADRGAARWHGCTVAMRV